MIKIRVPATSANLGPGFDCLALALDLWNEISFEETDGFSYRAFGEGAEKLNKGTKNLLTKAFAQVQNLCGKKIAGVNISAKNAIPMSSGLGSSAAAIVAGLYGANEILGKPLSDSDLFKIASENEGHPDNAGAVIYGGLIAATVAKNDYILKRFDIPEWSIAIVKPEVEWLTKTARAVLPKSVSRSDATYNFGRVALVIEALRTGDLNLLQQTMDDRIHQPYRLKYINGAVAAYRTARQFGAAALSGAGPSIIAFISKENAEAGMAAIKRSFEERGVLTKSFLTKPSLKGVTVT